jgi:hypothetical protein
MRSFHTIEAEEELTGVKVEIRVEKLEATSKTLPIAFRKTAKDDDVNPVRYFTEVAAVFVGERAPDVVIVEITKHFTLWSDGTIAETGYHYNPLDFFGKWKYETYTIGCIDFDPYLDKEKPGRFVSEVAFKGYEWRRIK